GLAAVDASVELQRQKRAGKPEERARGSDHRRGPRGQRRKPERAAEERYAVGAKKAPRADPRRDRAGEKEERGHVHGEMPEPGMEEAVGHEHRERLGGIVRLPVAEKAGPEARILIGREPPP